MPEADGVALVTGGSRGIGRAVVERVAAAGRPVVAVGRDRTALRDLEARAAAAGWHVTTSVCDVTDEVSVERLFREVHPVEVLVCSAGASSSAPLDRTSLEEWESLLKVNATGAFLCMRAALPSMRARNRGRIVVVASTAALSGSPYIAAYAASKHAAVGLVRVAAHEVAGTAVTVNAVCPTFIRTGMTERTIARISETTGRSPEEALAALVARSPLGRLLEPDEVAAAVEYLCSDAARALNGQTLVLDGGGVWA